MLLTNFMMTTFALAVNSDNMTIIDYKVSTRTGNEKEMTVVKENYASLDG